MSAHDKHSCLRSKLQNTKKVRYNFIQIFFFICDKVGCWLCQDLTKPNVLVLGFSLPTRVKPERLYTWIASLTSMMQEQISYIAY